MKDLTDKTPRRTLDEKLARAAILDKGSRVDSLGEGNRRSSKWVLDTFASRGLRTLSLTTAWFFPWNPSREDDIT
jgi:hypothetical protein